jgi:peptide/nickel transport system permease protein
MATFGKAFPMNNETQDVPVVISSRQRDRSSLGVRVSYALSSLRRSTVGMVGVAIVIAVLFMAIIGPSISPFDPIKHNLRARFKPPGYTTEFGTHWLGTDQLGRDILSRIILGSRVSVMIGLIAAAIGSTAGMTYGLISGFSGGWTDTILMRIADAFLAIPFIVLVVAISGVVGPGLLTLILILGFTGWVTYARVARGEVLVIRNLEYVTAARVIGQKTPLIILRHLLPNVMALAIVLAAMEVGAVILAESSLSFLGLGVQPPTVTWGLMLADGRQYLGSAWWMTTFPGIAISITVLGIVFVGDWLRDVLDPRMRGRD